MCSFHRLKDTYVGYPYGVFTGSEIDLQSHYHDHLISLDSPDHTPCVEDVLVRIYIIINNVTVFFLRGGHVSAVLFLFGLEKKQTETISLLLTESTLAASREGSNGNGGGGGW